MADGKKVMVAVDESECSLYALEWVLDNLTSSISGPLLIFTVQPIANLSYVYAASLGSAPPELVQSIQEHKRKVSATLVKHAKEICAKRGVTAETIIEVGDPKEAICEAAEKLKVNLLILGSHGRGALERVFLGSVSNYCVQNATCPVLVVKRPV